MACIERTAYPRFKSNPTAHDLHTLYTPTPEEIAWAQRAARPLGHRFTLLVLLKAFQRLGYFPRLEDVPLAVVHHIRGALHLPPELALAYDEPRTLYRHHRLIREYLQVTPYGKRALRVATAAITAAVRVMDNPADLINVAIEEFVKERCELPAFSTLDRFVGRIRTLSNGRLFRRVAGRLSSKEASQLEALLTIEPGQYQSGYSRLKQLPKCSSLTHLQALLDHLARLTAFGEIERYLREIPPVKIKHFAAEAKALDASELRKFTAPKRYTLLLCLIQRARVQALDDLGTMFIKRIARMHRRGKEALERLHLQHRATTENLVAVLRRVLEVLDAAPSDAEAGRQIRESLTAHGGIGPLLNDCVAIAAYSGADYCPLLWRFYRSHRATLFRLLRALQFEATSQDQSLIQALQVLLDNEHRRGETLEATVDLSFANERWQRIVTVRHGSSVVLNRRHLEVCVFSYLATELKSGDVCIKGSDAYADYRDQLLSWEACAPQVAAYCRELGFADTASGFVEDLRTWLTETADAVDAGYPTNGHVVLNEAGEPVLKRAPPHVPPPSAQALEAAVLQRLPERSLIDILCNVEHWAHWTRHFGPLSGSDPKVERATERYILTTFTYGCNLGPAQAARHLRGAVTPHMLSFVNRRHVSADKFDAALRDLINQYHVFRLPKLWGEGKTAAADGTKYDLYDQNLLAEYHIRYGGYGGIAYHHVADSYIALFSHFIPCGVWEAVYIIDGLLKNRSDIQPDTVHADTQGQSAPVFALAHLLGIKLMPRIRNWCDLVFYRPAEDATYVHIDALFGDTIDWELLETHWHDLLRVVLSIKAGKVSSSMLLRKLGNYSRKNRLYQAFRELGRVVRTVFLLRYISDLKLREQITASTNKVEAYNGFAKWLFFGGSGVIADNDPEEQEKAIKYNDVVANAVIFQNVVDQTAILRELINEGYPVAREDLAALSPYLTSHIKRFGDYVIDLDAPPQPLDGDLNL